MQKITPAQMRKIHMAARQNGMDDDLLHCHMAALLKKSSLRELTIHEAILLIDSLEGKQSCPKEDAATSKQIYYIKGLAKDLGWVDQDGNVDMSRVNGMCRQCAKVDNMRWLTKAGASQVIEALKSMLDRHAV